MTRFLSEALGAVEPGFRQNIARLEQAAGRPGADIRLTEEIKRLTGAKIAQLGLDPSDTTTKELCGALQQRMKADESAVREALSLNGASGENVTSSVAKFVDKLDSKPTCFALKNSVAKKLLKKKPPKIAMKRLGYRSIDSMLKHEQPATLYAAALITESSAWHRAYLEQYARLTSADFETRPVSFLVPESKKWKPLAEDFVETTRHNILSLKELGAVVLLPVHKQVDGLAMTSLLLVLEEVNAIRAHSSYVKLEQVKPDFGRTMRDLAKGEVMAEMIIAGQIVDWHTLQRFFAEHPDAYHPEIFEPHVQPEDLQWEHAEDVLARILPNLKFWQGTQALGLLNEREFVSCNALDVALGYCNNLSFGERLSHFVRGHIWHKLMLRYLNHGNLQQALHHQLSDELVEQPVLEG